MKTVNPSRLRMAAGEGEVHCPMKGLIALGRCKQLQAETKRAGNACTCTVYQAAVGMPPPKEKTTMPKPAPAHAPSRPRATASPIAPSNRDTAPPAAPTIALEEVTPAIATAWLEQNTENRPLSQARVEAYASDIAGGRWRVNGEAIKFAIDGHLLDGQHRLWGVVEADRAITTLVVRGLPPEVRATMDRHRPRSDADDLRVLRGLAESKKHVAAAKLIDLVVEGRVRLLTYAAVEDLIDRYQVGIAWSLRAARAKPLAFTPSAPEKLEELAAALRTGAGLEASDPALALRNYLLDRDRLRADGRRLVALKVLRATLAHVRGEKLGKLYAGEEPVEHFRAAYPSPEGA